MWLARGKAARKAKGNREAVVLYLPLGGGVKLLVKDIVVGSAQVVLGVIFVPGMAQSHNLIAMAWAYEWAGAERIRE